MVVITEGKVLRSKTALTNTLINAAGLAIPILATLATVPMYLDLLGEARFGVLSFAWLIVGYLGGFDLGMSRASINELAKIPRDSIIARGEVFSTALLSSAAVGGIVAACFAVIGAISGGLLDKLSAELLPGEWATCSLIISALVLVAMVTSAASGILEASERFGLINLIQVCTSVAAQGLPIASLWIFRPTLDVVLVTMLGVRAISLGVVLVSVVRTEAGCVFRVPSLSRLRLLFNYGAWIGLSGALGPLLAYLDQLIIGWVIGPAGLARYSLPMNLVGKTQILAAALARTMFPAISRSKKHHAAAATRELTVLLGYLYAAVCTVGIYAVEPFIAHWTSPEMAIIAGPIGRILFLGAWINGLAFMPYTLLQAQGKPNYVGLLHLAELAPFLLLVYIATGTLGLRGAALAWACRVWIDAIGLFWLSGLGRGVVAQLSPAAAACAFAYWLAEGSTFSEGVNIFLVFALGTTLVVVGALSRRGASEPTISEM